MRKLLIGALVAVGLVLAQTTVRVGMLSGPSGAGRVMVIAPNGTVTFAALGAGITLVDTGGGAWVLQSTASRIVGEKPVRQPDGSYLLGRAVSPGTLAVYRNGVRQNLGDDYVIDATARKVTPVTGLPWNVDDLVLADYE